MRTRLWPLGIVRGPYQLKKQRLQYWILGADIAWCLVALLLADATRYGFDRPAVSLPIRLVATFLVTAFLWTIIYTRMQLDGFRRGWHPSSIFSQLFVAVCFLMLILMASGYLLQIFVSRLASIYFCLYLFLGFTGIRYLVYLVLGSKYLAKAIRRVVIVGNGPMAREMAMKIRRHPEMLCKVVGFLYPADISFDPRLPGITGQGATVQTLGLIDLLHANEVDEVIITASSPSSPEVMNLASRCRQRGIGVSVIPQAYELYLSRPQLLDIGGLPVLQLRELQPARTRQASKRIFDLVLGLLLSVLSAPIVLIGAAGLIVYKRNPFTREVRCGQFGKTFWMYRLNSDRDAHELDWYEKFLQQLSITEMPQFWNVVRGEMSLVGPRPESPERVKHYSDWQRERLKSKPGITGLAQVNGLREQHSSEEKTRFDLQYMMDASLFLNISLILQTAWTLIGRLVRPYRLSEQPVDKTADDISSVERIWFRADSTQSSAH